MSLKFKILLPMILLTIVSALAPLVVIIFQFNDYVTANTSSNLDVFSRVLANEVESFQTQAQTASTMIANDAEIVSGIEASDRAAILSRSSSLEGMAGVDFCTILDPDGNVIVRVHEPDNYGDNLSNQDNISSAMGGKTLTTIEQGSAIKLSVRSGVPIYNNAGTLVGVVSSGFRLDQAEFVDRMKAELDTEITVFLGDERIATTVINPDGTRAIGTKAAEEVARIVLAGNSYSGEAQVVGQQAFVHYEPIKAHDGSVPGMLFVGRYATVRDQTIQSFILAGVTIMAALLAIAIPFIVLLVGRIIKPVHLMVQAADRLAAGDMSVDITVQSRDEIGTLAEAFQRMIDGTKSQADIVQVVAEGDFSHSVALRSEADVLNRALNQLLENNNHALEEINQASMQVSTGADQVAQAAQHLAQGSTEQSATVSDLSQSVSNVYDQTKENSKAAATALEQTRQTSALMRECDESMQQMLASMQKISQTAESIAKIIKVIDDIAFQTNILALNAAVEAARAGQHGKGFAVVADEVRNLAAKSALAAKDTAGLIEGSVASVQEGNEIVEKTNRSLDAVAECSTLAAQMIEKIDASSRSQEQAIASITQGIEQISAVVQTTTATAEESAATAEELSSQAAMLRQVVSRFKLQDGSGSASASNPGMAVSGFRF